MRVAVFAKAPVAGHVKTRLVPLLGADGAAGLHAGLVRHALATASLAKLGPIELWCAPDETHDFFARCAREFHAELRRQEGADLGERMRRAFEAARSRGERLLLIGCDCPVLTARHLAAAAAALDSHDAVFAPAEDGGYVLVGLSRDVPGIFDGIEWGSASVMAATRERLRAADARWHELAVLWDVDRPADYARLQREGLLQEVLS
ncbi:MAG TPA: TIGR04282 family arsenosugar biosynthesis glycosyltransferase [Usitatibacter sp.]|nr:TIGR04282 family arsenosugar biosynthesis glycosyltransferase [Usitatibacter sp.]